MGRSTDKGPNDNFAGLVLCRSTYLWTTKLVDSDSDIDTDQACSTMCRLAYCASLFGMAAAAFGASVVSMLAPRAPSETPVAGKPVKTVVVVNTADLEKIRKLGADV